MKKVFKHLTTIFDSCDSILEKIDEIASLKEQLKKEEDFTLFVNLVRTRVQEEAVQAVINNDGRGMIVMATGAGKSKIAIDLAKHYHHNYKSFDGHGLIVPTEKLRDENWKEEFEKWDAKEIYDSTQRLCYASASKLEDYSLNLLILDEAHNITELSAKVCVNNMVENVVALTATEPTDEEKKEIFERLGIPVVYKLSLDDAVKLGFVAPYNITVVYTELDDSDKYVQSGSKNKPFYQTEQEKYEYLTSVYNKSPNGKMKMFAIFNRMNFIYKLKSKFEVGKHILNNVIPTEDRTLIFCGSIEQANDINPFKYHSKTKDVDYNDFKEGKINRLSCVKSINEGHNFIGLDSALILQINSKEKDLIQRIGRLIRFRFGHEANIYIVICKGTQDEVWLSSAIENLNPDKIKFVEFSNIK